MTALAANKNTLEEMVQPQRDPVAASTHIYCGALVVLDSAGNAKPALTATGLILRGVARKEVNNTGGAGAAFVETTTGVFGFVNSASSDALTRAEIGDDVYIVDDQTVAKTSGSSTRTVAGKMQDLRDGLVYVHIKGTKS